MPIARVFPRRTAATPTDDLAFVGPPPMLPDLWPDVEAVHVSVTFTDDKDSAEQLAEDWAKVAPVKLGGPAYDDPGGEFEPGMYMKPGFTITSRGCDNRCWFCKVWERSGRLRELPIRDGWIIQDDNILACSRPHIEAVFAMLRRQKEEGREIQFIGGLEAALLKDWHVGALWSLRPKQMFFSYDDPACLLELVEAAKLLHMANFTRFHMRCYVLVGHRGDRMEEAEARLLEVWAAGFMPYAMLYMDDQGKTVKGWGPFMNKWRRPARTKAEVKRLFMETLRTI